MVLMMVENIRQRPQVYTRNSSSKPFQSPSAMISFPKRGPMAVLYDSLYSCRQSPVQHSGAFSLFEMVRNACGEFAERGVSIMHVL
jgi:hypothetical protein